jgi:hypothetical protein
LAARLATPFYFIVKRVFAKLVQINDGWGMNILVFDMATKTLEQITTGAGGQDAQFTDMKYDEGSKKLMFVIGGKIEGIESQIYPITEETLEIMLRTDNWERLCHGLSIRSKKTWDWCVRRGIGS